MTVRIIATGSSKWERLIRRWGVSFLIGEDVLFDTFGDPGVFSRNMRKFKIDSSKIKHIILSHDDWDHITGLWQLIEYRKNLTVYICPNFSPAIKERISSFGVKLVELGNAELIRENIYSTGELYGESAGRKIYEQSVAIKTGNGLVVVCGCAHPGVVNIVRHIKEIFHEDVCSILGGFHMKDNTDETNLNIIRGLRNLDVRRISPMHCTGSRATDMMRTAFGSGFISVREGGVLEL